MAAVSASPLRLAPRPYQDEAVAAVLHGAQHGLKRPLIALPTGTGKTIVFALLIQQRPGRALVLAHRDELIEQAVEKLHWMDPEMEIGVVKAERDEHEAPVVVASVQTLSRHQRLARLVPDFDTIIIDEAHHAPADTYRRILSHCQAWHPEGPLVVGVTATPERGDRKSLRQVFERIVYHKSLLEMILAGYLSDLRAIQVLLQADFDAVRVRKGDFVERDLETLLLEASAPAHVVAAFKTQASERKALLFTPTVALAHAMAETFCAAGIPAEALDGGTSLGERRAILQRLHTGQTRVVANCAVLTEGYDEPSVDCIIMARPTRSRPLYQQMLGRGTRTYPGKSDCLVLDVVGVSSRHTLQTVSTLCGFSPDDLDKQSLTEAVAERERREREQQEAMAGRLRSAPVNLFARRKLRWVQTRQGAWVLSLGPQHGILRLVPTGDETWQVMQVQREAGATIVAEQLPLAYAQGLGEDMARSLGVESLSDAEAPWRTQPASDKQMALLQKLGVAIQPELTKGEAADQIAAILGDWD
jgi:superfamily II DNA or RNA helicase